MEALRLVRVVGVLVVSFACFAEQAMRGLLSNPGFDDPSPGGAPPGWSIPAAARDVCQVADNDGHSGKQCLRFRIDKPRRLEPAAQAFACEPGRDYVLSAWFKTSQRSRPVACVVTPQGGMLAHVKSEGQEVWRGGEARFNSGTNTELVVRIYADVAGFLGGNTPEGIALVDDAQVWEEAEFERVVQASSQQPFGPKLVNVARGKPYTLEPRPNYSYCTDSDDTIQLTDGEYSIGYFWVQKGTVGWLNAPYATVTIDLGKVEPVCGLSFNTAAGTAGVTWPSAIFIFTSENGKDYFCAGDLVDFSRKQGPLPEPERYAVCRYATQGLSTKARFLRLVSFQGTYTFCDEIEIYRGAESLLQRAAQGKPLQDIKAFLDAETVSAKVRMQLLDHIDAIRAAAEERGIPPDAHRNVDADLSRLAAEARELKMTVEPGFRAISPLNPLHVQILKVNARVLRATGLPPFFAWHKNRWDPLSPVEAPETSPAGPPTLVIEMMENEYRAEVVNLTNATDASINTVVNIDGLPGGRNPNFVVVQQVEFVGTQRGKMIADPLPLAERKADGFVIPVPSGTTRQVWLTFHPRGVSAGEYAGTLRVTAGEVTEIVVPLTLRVYPFHFPDQPSLSLGMWDYVASEGGFGLVTPSNKALIIANMRAHFYDSPWGHRSTACWPEKEDFDADGNLVKPLRCGTFDRWVLDFKGARNFYNYVHMGRDFHGEPMGTPRFNRMVGSWAAAFARHAKERGISLSQIGLLLVDEPGSAEGCQTIAAWAKAIKAAAPGLVIWQDLGSTHLKPPDIELLVQACDVLCPHAPTYCTSDKTSQERLTLLRAKARRLWFYSALGPARLYDPYYYHRLAAWRCWQHGAVGMGFWNYFNYYERKGSAWNEYVTSKTSFGVVYVTDDSVTDGKHWEAVREGIKDYEYLRMLSDRTAELRARGVNAPALQETERLLKTAPQEVAGPHYEEGIARWSAEKDRSIADQCRARLLKALNDLKEL